MSKQLTAVFDREKSRLTIYKDNKPVGGFVGKIAHKVHDRIVANQITTNNNGDI